MFFLVPVSKFVFFVWTIATILVFANQSSARPFINEFRKAKMKNDTSPTGPIAAASSKKTYMLITPYKQKSSNTNYKPNE